MHFCKLVATFIFCVFCCRNGPDECRRLLEQHLRNSSNHYGSQDQVVQCVDEVVVDCEEVPADWFQEAPQAPPMMPPEEEEEGEEAHPVPKRRRKGDIGKGKGKSGKGKGTPRAEDLANAMVPLLVPAVAAAVAGGCGGGGSSTSSSSTMALATVREDKVLIRRSLLKKFHDEAAIQHDAYMFTCALDYD